MISVVYWLLTENYVLNANILVFMLIHTELFSNVSGLGLEKNFWASSSLFLASALCPAGLVNIPAVMSTRHTDTQTTEHD